MSSARFQVDPQARSRPTGICQKPDRATRCSTSCADRPRSASRSQMFWMLVAPPSQLTLPEACEPLSIILPHV
jgi:hypothetical protein